MSAGGRGFLRPRRRAALNVDMTPLIDIVFQLLIFFLLTATFQNSPSFKVKLPKAKNQDTTQDSKSVVVMIGEDGAYQVDNNVVDPRELELRLCAAAKDGRGGINIKADERTAHKHVVTVMDLAKTCGLQKLGILHGR